MFPNNMEFFVEERLKERYAEGEQYRLSRQVTGKNSNRIKRILATAVDRLSRLRQRAPKPLQVHAVQQPLKDTE